MKPVGLPIRAVIGLLSSSFAVSMSFAQSGPTIDGRFTDWTDVPPIYSDPQGDGTDLVDFGRVWMRNDDRFVYLSFEVGGEVNLESGSGIVLGLDTDHDASTGQAFESIGAELVWNFGDRIGSFESGGGSVAVAFQDVGLVSAPTVTSNVFEFCFELDSEPRRLGLLFPADTVGLVLAHGSVGDRLPDAGEEAVFVIDRDAELRSLDVRLDREESSTLRILSWNVEQDGLFESNRSAAFKRIFRAAAPDVIVLAEIFTHTANQTLERITELAPPEAGSTWFAAAAKSSVVLVSKTPILQTVDVEQNGRAGGFLVGRPPGFDHDVFVVGAHLFCCDADARRQLQVDQIMATIRDARDDGSLPGLTPIIIAGDMNFVGDRRQPMTLIEGSIVNASAMPSFEPDWDGTHLADALPHTTGLPQTFTWISPQAPGSMQFSPGRLDYVIYSDAVLSKGNSFALYTPGIPFVDRERLGLSATDTDVASDHLPIVADFVPSTSSAVEFPVEPRPGEFELDVFPNPASDRINIQWSGPTAGRAPVEIFDALGRRVSSVRLEYGEGEPRRASIDIRRLPSGFYLVVAHSARATIRRGFVKNNATN